MQGKLLNLQSGTLKPSPFLAFLFEGADAATEGVTCLREASAVRIGGFLPKDILGFRVEGLGLHNLLSSLSRGSALSLHSGVGVSHCYPYCYSC